MQNKHLRTLKRIFEKPTRSNILWKDIESLFRYLGASITEGAGSRIRIALKDMHSVYHRPHPRKETVKGAVEQVRKDLNRLGVKP